ncbi:MAG: helix-turn-helix domain-containing protein [Actinomycetota bacterium]
MARIDVSGLGSYIREQRDQAQMSVRQLAAAAGVSNPYLSQVERGLRRPSAEILSRLAGALRISAETLYVQAGILSEPQAGDEGRDLATAISQEPSLTEAQRRTLLEIYRAFQAENRIYDPESAEETPRSPRKETA